MGVIRIYKIGEFAKLVNANIKTIRYYDDINLLKPKEIDKFTSYRYYNDENIREYYSILLLKKMGFSLNEIKANKDNLRDELFLEQREKLLHEILYKKEIIKTIDKIRSNIIDGNVKLDEFNYEFNNIDTKKKKKFRQ